MAETTSSERLPLRKDGDILYMRQMVRERIVAIGFRMLDTTKLLTAASELGRNVLVHGGGGAVVLETVTFAGRVGLRMTFEDEGPGIPDMALAMTDGYTSGGGMGLGLSGSKRLVDDFDITSEVGKGTRVCVTKWK